MILYSQELMRSTRCSWYVADCCQDKGCQDQGWPVSCFNCWHFAWDPLLRAEAIRASEAARGEPTMGPGIFQFLGFVAAVLGSLIFLAMATAVLWLYAWCRARDARN